MPEENEIPQVTMSNTKKEIGKRLSGNRRLEKMLRMSRNSTKGRKKNSKLNSRCGRRL